MICRAAMENARAVAGLAVKMWDENTIEEMTAEFEMIIEDKDAAVFLYYDGDTIINSMGRSSLWFAQKNRHLL